MPASKAPAEKKAAFEPPWGADGWPRAEGELDEGDHLLIREMLERTPEERLRYLEEFVNGWGQVKRVRRVSSD